MSVFPRDEDDGHGAPKDGDDLGHAPTMLYMKPARPGAVPPGEDVGGKTLVMIPAVGPGITSDEDSGGPVQGPLAGPLPDGEGLAELDSARTMVYMPAVGGPTDADGSGLSEEVRRKLDQLRDSLGDGGSDAGSHTVAYMPAVGSLPVDEAVARMMETTGRRRIVTPAAGTPVQDSPAAGTPAPPARPRIPTQPAFSAVKPPAAADLGDAPTDTAPPGAFASRTAAKPAAAAPASPRPVFAPGPAAAPRVSRGPSSGPSPLKPGPDLEGDEEPRKGHGGLVALLIVLLVLAAGGVVVAALLFEWIPRPEFLEFLPHLELSL